MGKPWRRSRTLIVNAVMAGLVVLEEQTGVLQPLLPVNFYVLLATLLPVINAMLRVATREPLSWRGEK